MTQPLYSCKYCKKQFFNERTFMRHECTQMVRSREIQTAIGAQGYGLYKVWLEKQRRKPPAVEGFMTSAYYTGFVNFAQWCRDTGIPDPEKYVELMVKEKISPSLWRRNEAYQIFLEYTDKRSNPFEQVQNTIETLLTLSEGLGIPMGDVFARFTPGEVTELIQQRRLSPWLLFCSKRFKGWVSSLHESERRDLMQHIGINYWSQRLEKSPDIVKEVKVIAEQLDI